MPKLLREPLHEIRVAISKSRNTFASTTLALLVGGSKKQVTGKDLFTFQCVDGSS